MNTLGHSLHLPSDDSGRDATPLVLLHAYPLDSSMWDEVISHLRDTDPRIPILTIDAPGFGTSAPGEEIARTLDLDPSPSLETYAHGIAAVLNHLGFEKVAMAGLSLGGYAALAFAEHYPERLAGLGLLDTKAEADDEPARKVRLATAVRVVEEGIGAIEGSVEVVLGETTRATAPDVVAEVRAQILAAPPEGVAWIQRAMAARPSRLHVLEALHIPALVLRGEEDELSSAGSAEAMATALHTSPAVLGGSGVVTLPGVGHMSANEAPARVASALADLWSRVEAI